MSNSKVPVFHKTDQPRMMSVAELIAAQRWHDEHKDDKGHFCDFCPVSIVISKEQMNEFHARTAQINDDNCICGIDRDKTGLLPRLRCRVP